MQELGERALKDLVELLEKGIEVVPPYLADLFHRYMIYGIFKESFLFLLSFIAVAVSIRGGYKILRKEGDEEEKMAVFLLLFPLCFGLVGIIFCGMDLFEAIFIPEVYIIHDLQGCSSCN